MFGTGSTPGDVRRRVEGCPFRIDHSEQSRIENLLISGVRRGLPKIVSLGGDLLIDRVSHNMV
jgi:hypothetical protein